VGTRSLSLVALILGMFLGHSVPSIAHSMPAELWVLWGMPSCMKHLDGFAARSESPYAQWRQKHGEEVTEYEWIGMNGPNTTQHAHPDSDSHETNIRMVGPYYLHPVVRIFTCRVV
jgi:hypothetical protein